MSMSLLDSGPACSARAERFGFQPDSDAGARSKDPDPTTKKPGKAVAMFEFINVNEKDSTKRAKSHAAKDFRARQKNERTRFQKLKEHSCRKLIAPAVPVPQTREAPSPIDTTLEYNQVDPFNLFPTKLKCNQDLALINHFQLNVVPKPFEVEGCDYRPVRELIFDLAVKDAPAFLLIVASAAEDIALRLNSKVCQRGIEYKGEAMAIINQRMTTLENGTSDESLAACALLAGFELLFGYRRAFEIHMNGIYQMINLRGGFQVVQESNPKVASLIAWIDHASFCGLVGRRRFDFTSLDSTRPHKPGMPLRFRFPGNVPLAKTPRNYTLYDDLMILLEGLENATTIKLTLDDVDPSKITEYEAFVQGINTELMRILTPHPKHTIRFRRVLIEDCYRLAAIIYVSGLGDLTTSAEWTCDVFLQDVSSLLLDLSKSWGQSIAKMIGLLMKGGKAQCQENIDCIDQLADVSVTLDWTDWKNIRDKLLAYLLYSEVCAGKQQDLWLQRTEVIQG